ncbi:D-alanine--D-alanine ligase [Bosea sp. 62]|uniref:D-alanine--D-alanine ligase n=1 Tax=unclassified Bosea (in: a-proteobacteria) TaxID=2653178 RepID=UPI001256D080|nr:MULTISPECIES: D-alanine--D-alanine ligase [unclassified Bosea (in: a-proteobacteria)]CAD5246561.1 D-alanine--D-alanine ligase [Bosea sp. 7B]CAD5247263.1 D-alanine--D-alanine ligase [Bosea sp. 21B]CAD5269776.1 D-alanine--D-alanine ligase [Bosea sp. 46]VVT50844.1 D-alanine--D-alanine ligase [Bosea sp. EC-HK365B]VXA96005.1 D-alanine--D-alanine ligase [Bosea sp. 127]
MSKHVAVLMGGWSVEREVSLSSGAACARALEGVGYRVTRVEVNRDVAEVLAKLKPDVAFNALHGRYGEDGTIQGVLEILGIPYTHSGVLASSLAIRKDKAKMVVAAAGVPVAKGVTVSRFEAAKRHPLPPPYVIKPIDEGSSVGVVIVKKGREHPPQEIARPDWPCGETMLAETFIAGRELTCAVMDGKSLGVTEIRAATGEFYDYDAKYAKGGSIHICPAQILPNLYRQIEECALTAHQAIGCRGVSRSDFRYDDESDTLVWLEVNTQPGMTETSLVPELAAHAGMNFGELVKWIVEDASLNR